MGQYEGNLPTKAAKKKKRNTQQTAGPAPPGWDDHEEDDPAQQGKRRAISKNAATMNVRQLIHRIATSQMPLHKCQLGCRSA